MSSYDMNRRNFLKSTGITVAGASMLGVAGCLGGEGSGDTDYPSDEVRSIVPYSAGGGFDAYARVAAPYWEEHLGTEIVVENVEGGGGRIGAGEVFQAEPDGYTKLIWAPGEAMPAVVGMDVGFDLQEMSHIGFLTQTPAAIVISQEPGVTSWDEFADRIDEFDFATQGVGTMAHAGMEILAELSGDYSRDDLNFVHYAGTGEVLAGLERGEANGFLITAGDSGANVVQAIEGTELFLVFSSPDDYEWYFDDVGVDVRLWGPDVNTDGMEELDTIASMRRFYTGPPGVPDDILEIQREAFDGMINDQDFLDEAMEAGRPVLEPGDHNQVDQVIQESHDLLSSEPYVSMLQDMF